MKKISVIALLLILVVGTWVYAGNVVPSNNRFSELTEEQQAEIDSIWQQMDDLRVQLVGKMAEFGMISAERAEWMQEGWELKDKERGTGYVTCHDEEFQRRGRFGRFGGMMRGF